MDAEPSDAAASRGRVRGGVSVWARGVGEPYGRGADRGGDRAGCVGRSSRPQEKNGHSGGRATGYSGRPHDRERVLHLFRRGGDGVAMAAGFVFCARGGDGFLARAGDEGGTFRLGRECDAADVVGAGAGSIALEPRVVCGNVVPVLLLFGTGIGADARASSAGG